MISVEKQRQIRLLLQRGLSQKEVAKRAGVSEEIVNKITEPSGKQQKPKPTQELEQQKPKSIREFRMVPPCLTCHVSEVPELIRIANDLQEFHKLQLVSHPLLKELARQARESLKRILPGSM